MIGQLPDRRTCSQLNVKTDHGAMVKTGVPLRSESVAFPLHTIVHQGLFVFGNCRALQGTRSPGFRWFHSNPGLRPAKERKSDIPAHRQCPTGPFQFYCALVCLPVLWIENETARPFFALLG